MPDEKYNDMKIIGQHIDRAYYKRILKKNGERVISAKETISQGAEGIPLECMLEGYADFAEKTKHGRKRTR